MADTILVTGGAGYVGSHCCKRLAAEGFRPIVYDSLSTGHRDFVKWGPLIEGDIRDRGRLAATVSQYKPVMVMHFAALALVEESFSVPDQYWSVNVGGVLSLLEVMRERSLDKLVFSSTAAVYGVSDEQTPLSETAPKAPVNPYGASKLTAEWILESFESAYGMKSVRLRYFNACGADPECEIGEDHSPETHLVPILLDVAAGRRKSFSIFGTDYPTPDGTAVRDFIHVEDLASAHCAAAKYLLDGGATAAINLGSGKGSSVASVTDAVERITGRHIETVQLPRRAGDPAYLVANPGRAKRLLGWQAQRSGLDMIVADAWRWHGARFAAPIPAQSDCNPPSPNYSSR